MYLVVYFRQKTACEMRISDWSSVVYTSDLALRPQAAGLVEEVLHLRRHVAIAGRRPDDDGVVVRQLVDGRDRRRLIQLEARILRDVLRHQFRSQLDQIGRASRRAGVSPYVTIQGVAVAVKTENNKVK